MIHEFATHPRPFTSTPHAAMIADPRCGGIMIPFLDVLLLVAAFCSVSLVIIAVTSERRR